MRVGVITDIHNNIVALNAVLDRLYTENCRKIICCGDIIGIGPYPEETVRRAAQIPNLIAVRGNHERYLLEGMPRYTHNREKMGREEMLYHRWEHALLSPPSVEFLRGLPYRRDIEIGGIHIAVMHYCMNRHSRYIRYTPHPDVKDCRRMFKGVNADVILYGHDHRPAVNRDGDRLFADCGSLGCPARDGDVARAGILTVENGKVDFDLVAVRYDTAKVVDDINRLAYPAADEVKRMFFGIN